MFGKIVVEPGASSSTLAACSMVMLCCWAKLLMVVLIDLRLFNNFILLTFLPFDAPISL
jgi:hypothetical protein